jgi:hypothetical protein
MTNSSKSWTGSISDAATKAGTTIKDTATSASKTAERAYNDLTHNGSSRSTLGGNSNFSSDARDIARDAERMKDKALRDVDRRFG